MSAPVGNFQRALLPLLVPVGDLTPDAENARIHGDENMEAIRTSLTTFSQVTPIVFWRHGDQLIVIKGNGTFRAACELGWSHVAATEFEGSEVYARAYAIADNRTAELAQWDQKRLDFQMSTIATQWDPAASVAWEPKVVGWSSEALDDAAPKKPRERAEKPPEPEAIDVAFEVVKTEVTRGDVYELPSPTGLVHRVMCGDSTDPEDVGTLMAGEKATLLHADGPYGAGKESDGVANDNLHGAELDAFQVKWWNACAYLIKDTASVYIWGTAPDLWRLWYRYLDRDAAGLPAAVALPLSIRNEIVWDKGDSGHGISSDNMRSYAPNTERALFLMLGEQELSTNADEYWEGWTPLLEALSDELKKAGWSGKKVAEITEVTGHMASHWFGKSQWAMIPEERYLKLQAAGVEADAFQYPYADIRAVYEQLRQTFDEEIRSKFYDGRAFFDNAHDAMTEVWSFPRVVGEERFGHPTPKPVLMIARAIKSSCPAGEIVLEPFAGSGSTLIAAEETGRRCFTMEILPEHAATTIARWEAKTGAKAVKVSAC